MKLGEKLDQYKWPFAEQDLSALGEIARRVAQVGRDRDLITYSTLVEGIAFKLPTVNAGEALTLGVPEWIDLHRTILGDFLGRLCLATYERGGFMGSAIVISGDRARPYPSEGFRRLMRDLGLLQGNGDDEFMAVWSSEVQKAYDWYESHTW